MARRDFDEEMLDPEEERMVAARDRAASIEAKQFERDEKRRQKLLKKKREKQEKLIAPRLLVITIIISLLIYFFASLPHWVQAKV
jgi:hypothetical protein